METRIKRLFDFWKAPDNWRDYIEEREDRQTSLKSEAPGVITLSPELLGKTSDDALHGSPAPSPQTDLYQALIDWLNPQSEEHPIESREDSVIDTPSHSTGAAQAPVRKDAPPAEKLVWIEKKRWWLDRIRRKIKVAGYFLFALDLGLADSVIQWAINGQPYGCYQMPYYSFFGCLDISHSWEVVFIFFIMAAAMIGV